MFPVAQYVPTARRSSAWRVARPEPMVMMAMMAMPVPVLVRRNLRQEALAPSLLRFEGEG